MTNKKHRRTSKKTRRTRRTRRHHKKTRKGYCLGRKRFNRVSGGVCPCAFRQQNGGNYATDITSHEFQGFPYKSEKSTVVAFPGTPGVMDLKDYKAMMEDEDREGYDPTA